MCRAYAARDFFYRVPGPALVWRCPGIYISGFSGLFDVHQALLCLAKFCDQHFTAFQRDPIDAV
jgi:hypothetical protein